jgi:DNA topoisomerase I
MSKSLVIVESPAKAKTISKYLGKDFTVEASVGHIKDLPKNKIGVDLSDGSFAPDLIVIPGKEKVVDRLKKLAKSSSVIYLAPDPDREGEAIAAHLEDELRGLSKDNSIRRVTFNEITQKAVLEAFEHTRDVDRNLVDAQQTRRVLDRIVGYQISPLLWDKVRRGLSAGRVQTVALRLIVEREREIKAFVPVEYWTLDAHLTPANDKTQFTARFNGIDGEKATVETVDAPSLPGKAPMDAVVAALANAKWAVDKVERKERRRNATAPFTTSKLQQDASRQLGFSVRRTMGVAQRLYEGIDLGVDAGGLVGLITYMRTDSTRVSPDAITEVRQWIAEKHGKEYLPAAPNAFKSKKDAQDAHEAIRPTSVALHPDDIKGHLSDEQLRLYRLIWQRFVASQMVPAVFDQTTVDIVARADRSYNFRVTGSVMKFDGFLKVYEEAKDKKDEEDEELKNRLPALENGQSLALSALLPEQHMTEPRPRFNEASLVKELEERGIGRPSTYATIINTIQEREYVQKVGVGRGAKFIATEIGFVVTDLLVANFPYIFDPKYTARLEEELDDIEDGKEKWTTLLGAFYSHFEQELEHAGTHMENIKRMEKPTDEKCDVCGSPLVLKWGKFGSFFACSTYDKKDKNSCTFTKENFAAKPEMNTQEGQDGEQAEEYCEACGRVMVLKRGRFGAFMACPGYSEDPPCKTTRKLTAKQQQKAPQPLDEKCPRCSEQLVLRTGQYGEFVSCSGYPKCKYIKQNLVEGMKCPTCGDGDIAERKARRGNLFYGCTNYPKCDFTSNFKPVPEKCPECGSPYLLEKTRVAGTFLVCPNNRKAAAEDEAPKKRSKKGAAEEPAEQVVCGYSKKIAEPQAEPVESMRYQVKAEALPVA